MKKYLHWMSHLIEEFDNVKLELIPREENLSADKVARISLTKDALATEGLLMEVQKISNIDELQALSIQQPSNWMEPIISYIRNG